jgi:SAM-dependent methyltransferase
MKTIRKKLIGQRGHGNLALRNKRMKHIKALIEKAYAKFGEVKILDIGGLPDYWDILPKEFLKQNHVSIVCANIFSPQQEDDAFFSFIQADGCDLSQFPDQSFHIVHSNSVIEHVGDWEKMFAFANEAQRVGKVYFVQTPNYWFPVEPHYLLPFIHWIPLPMQIWWHTHFSNGASWKKAANIDSAMKRIEAQRLLSKPMLKELFPQAKILMERVALLAKSYMVIGGDL